MRRLPKPSSFTSVLLEHSERASMENLGLQLTFSDADEAATFAAELKKVDFSAANFRVSTFEEKQNFDAETLVLVLKITATAAPALVTFVKFVLGVLKRSKKPSVSLRYNDRVVELRGDATDEDVKKLCDVLLGGK